MWSDGQISAKSVSRIASFAVLDLETSNLPAYNYNKAGITELCLYGIAAKTLNESNQNAGDTPAAQPAPIPKFPRVLHKLTLLLNPRMLVHPATEQITALNNNVLEHENAFDENAAITVLRFLQHLQQPVCLVAHNGWYFDFPLVKQAFDKLKMHLPKETMCLDSLEALWKIEEQQLIVTLTPNVPPLHCIEAEDFVDDASVTIARTVDAAIDWRAVNETTPKRPTSSTEPPVPQSKLNKRKRIEIELAINDETAVVASASHSVYLKPLAEVVDLQHTVKSRRELFPSNSNSSNNASAVGSGINIIRMVYDSNRNRGTNCRKYPPKGLYKLGNIYKRIFGQPMPQAHYAEADVAALLKLMLHYGVNFLNYAEQHAIPFAEVRKLGTSTN